MSSPPEFERDHHQLRTLMAKAFRVVPGGRHATGHR
jgi:hypothetical protein